MGLQRGHSRGTFLKRSGLAVFLFHQLVVLIMVLWEVFVVGTRMLVLSMYVGHYML